MAEQEVKIAQTPVGTFNDLMSQLQQEIEDVKTGKTSESTARVILGIRKGQIKMAELGLQYMRLIKPKGQTGTTKIPILPGSVEEK